MKKIIVTLGLGMLGALAYGQVGGWGTSDGDGWGTSSNDKKKEKKKEDGGSGISSDTAKADASEGDNWGSNDNAGWGDNSGDAWGASAAGKPGIDKAQNKVRDFQRLEKVNLPFDSIRKIILYTGIQELEECEFCTEDSLYYRFKIWAENKFGNKTFKDKKVLALDQKFQKINLRLNIPFMVKNNPYTTSENGAVNINLTVWFQPYRYKYLFTNFVHEVPPTGTQTEAQMVYFEYYQESKKNQNENNRLLNAIDDQVKAYIDGMKIALNDKPVSLLDEDDW